MNKLLLFVLISWLIVHCGQDKNSSPEPVKIENGSKNGSGKVKNEPQGLKKTKFTVAVIDDGFDLDLPIFKGKTIGKLTIKCDKKDEKSEKLSFEELKKKTIAEFKNPSETCEIKEGIKFAKSSSFEEIESYREEWNEKLRMKNQKDKSINPQIVKKISAILGGERKYQYHGTYVASLIAYQNENVEFVFVQYDLAKSNDDLQSDLKCLTQSAIDMNTKVFKDPDVIEAAKAAELSPSTKKLDEYFKKYQVDFVNTSFGSPVTKVLEDMYAKKGCPRPKLGKYIAANAELERMQSEAQLERNLFQSKTLTISAAGNDGAEITSSEVSDRCSSFNTINVGSLDSGGKVSKFSNYGKCADVYIGGEDVIAMAPNGFLYSTSGTSFSSPLFLRHLTLSLKNPQESYKSIYEEYKGSGKKLKSGEVPMELFSEEQEALEAFKLTDQYETNDQESLKPFVLGRIGGIWPRY